MVTPVSKADMDPNFEGRLRDAQISAAEEYSQRRRGGRAKWFRPVGWDGDIFDYEGMHEPFDRLNANDDYRAAVQDPTNPGTTGDVVLATTQIDYLATMETAFRVRHTMRRTRAMAHMLGRKKGQGMATGPFIQLGVEYARALLRQAKQK